MSSRENLAILDAQLRVVENGARPSDTVGRTAVPEICEVLELSGNSSARRDPLKKTNGREFGAHLRGPVCRVSESHVQSQTLLVLLWECKAGSTRTTESLQRAGRDKTDIGPGVVGRSPRARNGSARTAGEAL